VNADNRIVPVLMFHSVGLESHPWVWNYISEPLESFERKIAQIKKWGFHCVTWAELYDHMSGTHLLRPNSILLTFDDGYLDNWVYVYPLLRKYGMRGTIFVSPDFVDPSPNLRPNLDDLLAGQCTVEELQVAGFLSWAEMRAMERSGVIDIQSHAMTHTWYFDGPCVVDFHAPNDVPPYPWLLWNARPDRKPYYLNEDQQGFLPWGFPILEHGKSLVARRFFPDESAVDECVNFVTERGGRDFFLHPEWRDQISSFTKSRFEGGLIPGQYESDDARMSRIEDELGRSKSIIETQLGKRVEFICWPGGANDSIVQRLAAAVGYKSWTLDSRRQLRKRNRPDTDPMTIKRIGTSNTIRVRGRSCGTGGPRFQLWRIREHQGSTLHSLAIKGYKVAALLASLGGRA
jgi:hypothetical protein